jgi:hypothetical protein
MASCHIKDHAAIVETAAGLKPAQTYHQFEEEVLFQGVHTIGEPGHDTPLSVTRILYPRTQYSIEGAPVQSRQHPRQHVYQRGARNSSLIGFPGTDCSSSNI